MEHQATGVHVDGIHFYLMECESPPPLCYRSKFRNCFIQILNQFRHHFLSMTLSFTLLGLPLSLVRKSPTCPPITILLGPGTLSSHPLAPPNPSPILLPFLTAYFFLATLCWKTLLFWMSPVLGELSVACDIRAAI
jgi:hypothetical protein